MRATLEQLKAMSAEEIHGSWRRSEFPFDGAAVCGHCVTSHQVMNMCKVLDHKDFRARATELWQKINDGSHGVGEGILELAGEIHALRKDQQEKYERLLLLIGITAQPRRQGKRKRK